MALVCAALLAGCSDLGDPLRTDRPAAGQCVVEPLGLDFGSVEVGQSSEQALRILNVGTGGLSADLTLSCSDYSFVSGGGAQTIAPGETLTVTVRYAPSSGGPSSCTVLTGLECAEVVLSANGFVPVTVSFAADIQPILTNRCLGCHGPPLPSANMNLGAGTGYASLVNVVSSGYAPALRVAPGDTTGSVLFHKVFGTGVYGARMPQGGAPLPPAELDRIRTWIVEGARNN